LPCQGKGIAVQGNGNPFSAHLFGEPRSEFGVEAPQQPGAAVGECRRHAEPVEDRGELDGDVAAADDQRAARQFLQEEGLVRGDREFLAGNVGQLRPGSRRNKDVFCRMDSSIQGNGVRIQNNCAAPKNRNPRIDQDALVDAVQARDLAVLVRQQLAPVEDRLGDAPAEIGGVLQFVAEVRRVGEEFLRDAADVDAGAAEAARLRDRDARAERGRDAAGANAPRAAAYREEIEIEIRNNAGTT